MAPNDATPDSWIDRRSYVEAVGGLAAGGTLALPGCTDDASSGDPTGDDGDDGAGSGTGYLATAVTDQPTDIDDFESCVVTVDGVWLGPRTDREESDEEQTDDGSDEDQSSDTTQNESTSEASAAGAQPDENPGNGPGGDGDGGDENDGGEADEDGEDGDEDEEDDEDDRDDGEGRQYLAFDEPQEADLVELQGDQTQLIDEREVSVGTYQYLQLDVSGVEGVLNDGSDAVVETPGNAPLKFQEAFDVREGVRTTFTADFAPVRRGNGTYLIKPVARGVEVSYTEVDEPQGDESDGDENNRDNGGDDETTTGE